MSTHNRLRGHRKTGAMAVVLATAVCAAMAVLGTAGDSQSGAPKAPSTEKDNFVGQYVGALQPLGEYVLDPDTGKKQFKQQKCGSCHIDANVERVGDGYRLTMMVDHGKDKEGKPRVDKFVLEGAVKDGTVVFSKAPWSITLRDGEATGKYQGRKVSDLKLNRKTDAPGSGAAPQKPPSPPEYPK